MSDGLARRRFGGAGAIVGRTILLEGDPYTVIGVMPPGFENVLAPAAEVWAPRQYRAVGFLRVGRVGPPHAHGGEAQAGHRASIRPCATSRPSRARRSPSIPGRRGPTSSSGFGVHSLQHDVVRGAKPVLLAILGAVLLVLAIACVNVTNLLLAHGARRRGEFALRVALGAPRQRLIRQLLTESLTLASLGGAAGIAVAMVGVRALEALAPAELPRAPAIRLDAPVLAFALVVTALIGLVVGFAPALGASRDDPHAALQLGSRRAAGGRGNARSTLVIAEVALALVLLVGAGLLLAERRGVCSRSRPASTGRTC